MENKITLGFKFKGIEIKNFKSLKDTKIELGKFNVLIGANGSGKSNILDAFRFLKEITSSQGTINPFLKYGGYKNLVWKGKEELPITFYITFGDNKKNKLTYKITITGYGGRFEILEEAIEYNDTKIDKSKDTITFSKIRTFMGRIFVYHFIPQLMKMPSKFEEETLNFNGDNLQTFLYKIFSENQGWPEDITKRLEILSPQIESMRIIPTPDGRVMLEVFENGTKYSMNSLSDGFRKILGVLALSTEIEPYKNSLILLEEVENSLHPQAIEIIIDALKESKNQIIITTHSPVVLNMADIKDILLVKKEVDETVVEKVKDHEKLKEELIKNGISVGEGWLLGTLE